MVAEGAGPVNLDVPSNFVKEHVLDNFMKYFSGVRVNLFDLNGESSFLSNLSFSA